VRIEPRFYDYGCRKNDAPLVQAQGRRQKIFQGEQRKQIPKISKEYRKIALLSLYHV